jgi:Thiamine pyrophosphate enzyme, N-terminal TPP binding domain
MADRTGGELIQDFLGTYEIPFVFGNPGTTETTFLAAVAASKATYVLALHESSAVGIAAGYALITGKPSIVSLHTYPGLANGVFNLVKSRDGTELKIVLADNAVAVGVVKAALADIKPGSFVGIAAMGGEKTIIVPPDAPVVTFAPGDKTDLKPGTKIFILAAKKLPDGTLQAARVNYGKDGLAPPM